MAQPTRQHHTMATKGQLTPAPGGPPTSDVFEGKGGAAGDIHKSDGSECPADDYGPPSGNEANPSKGRW